MGQFVFDNSKRGGCAGIAGSTLGCVSRLVAPVPECSTPAVQAFPLEFQTSKASVKPPQMRAGCLQLLRTPEIRFKSHFTNKRPSALNRIKLVFARLHFFRHTGVAFFFFFVVSLGNVIV